MRRNLRHGVERAARHGAVDRWMIAVEAIVAVNEDPEGMHRIKVVIPAIEENQIHDEWVSVAAPSVGAAGYGAAHAPALGSEVLLFGRLGEPHTLFCFSRFNEDFPAPPEFRDGSRGFKAEGTYRLLSDGLLQLKSGARVEADAPDVLLQSGGAVGVHAQGAKIGFMGAAPVARPQLPGPAVDEASDRALTNALREALIALGLCE